MKYVWYNTTKNELLFGDFKITENGWLKAGNDIYMYIGVF